MPKLKFCIFLLIISLASCHRLNSEQKHSLTRNLATATTNRQITELWSKYQIDFKNITFNKSVNLRPIHEPIYIIFEGDLVRVTSHSPIVSFSRSSLKNQPKILSFDENSKLQTNSNDIPYIILVFEYETIFYLNLKDDNYQIVNY